MVNQITPLVGQGLTPLLPTQKPQVGEVDMPTFVDVFKRIAGDAAATQSVKAQDMLDLMLGDVDDIERIQANIVKAQLSMDLLTNTRNALLDSYNEIIKMAI
ncbi:MAG: flagellar hook-basal body complex protein FliE [Oscillospiraceae bacterium]|nr:flagellar hook-basal body complex protein FliE [Oscillospiraceae bacterium]